MSDKLQSPDEHGRPSAAEASITSLSIFVGVSLAVIGFLLSRPSVQFGYNATAVGCSSLAVAVALFLASNEFFILGIHQPEHHDFFVPIGSTAYGCGVAWMAVGVSLAFKSLGMPFLSYLFLGVTLFSLILYYLVRMLKLRKEEQWHLRMVARLVCLAVLSAGFGLLETVGK